jgi:hypothetical protein
VKGIDDLDVLDI